MQVNEAIDQQADDLIKSVFLSACVHSLLDASIVDREKLREPGYGLICRTFL